MIKVADGIKTMGRTYKIKKVNKAVTEVNDVEIVLIITRKRAIDFELKTLIIDFLSVGDRYSIRNFTNIDGDSALGIRSQHRHGVIDVYVWNPSACNIGSDNFTQNRIYTIFEPNYVDFDRLGVNGDGKNANKSDSDQCYRRIYTVVADCIRHEFNAIGIREGLIKHQQPDKYFILKPGALRLHVLDPPAEYHIRNCQQLMISFTSMQTVRDRIMRKDLVTIFLCCRKRFARDISNMIVAILTNDKNRRDWRLPKGYLKPIHFNIHKPPRDT